MRTHKLIASQELVENKVVCNKCGLTFDDEKSPHGYEVWQWDAIHHFAVEFGYGSDHDLHAWTFDLCEDCIEEVVSTFKIKPESILTELQ